MADGLLKAEKDFTKEVDTAIPEAETIGKVGHSESARSSLSADPVQSDVQAAVDKLLSLEKQTRQASDLPSTSRLLVAIVTICKNVGDWTLLNEQVQLLSKKHGQLKQAVTKMVQVVMEFLDQTPNEEVKLSVIETLRTVTEGKVSIVDHCAGAAADRSRSSSKWNALA